MVENNRHIRAIEQVSGPSSIMLPDKFGTDYFAFYRDEGTRGKLKDLNAAETAGEMVRGLLADYARPVHTIVQHKGIIGPWTYKELNFMFNGSNAIWRAEVTQVVLGYGNMVTFSHSPGIVLFHRRQNMSHSFLYEGQRGVHTGIIQNQTGSISSLTSEGVQRYMGLLNMMQEAAQNILPKNDPDPREMEYPIKDEIFNDSRDLRIKATVKIGGREEPVL